MCVSSDHSFKLFKEAQLDKEVLTIPEAIHNKQSRLVPPKDSTSNRGKRHSRRSSFKLHLRPADQPNDSSEQNARFNRQNRMIQFFF